MRLLVSVWLVFAVVQLGSCYMDKQAMMRLIKKLKGEHYMKEMMPQLQYKSNGKENPLTVTVQAYIRALTDLDTNKGHLGVQMTFRQEWTDTRFTPVCADAFQPEDGGERMPCAQLYGKDVDMAWQPDTFFRNEVESWVHNDLLRNNYLRFYPGGELVNSQRITTMLYCPEAIGAKQGDHIECKMQIASWGFHTGDLIYQWKADKPLDFFAEGSSSINEITHGRCDVTTDTGTYSCMEAVFKITVDYNKAPHYHSEGSSESDESSEVDDDGNNKQSRAVPKLGKAGWLAGGWQHSIG